jgi:dTMP kinase
MPGPGVLIVLEGIDRAGKGTQTRRLARRLERTGRRVETIAFPDYTTPIGREIRASLQGERQYPREAHHLLLALNRWERAPQLRAWLQEGAIVVADRYSPSNLAYGLASGLSREWLLCLERGLPQPDLVVVLDLPPEVALKRGPRERDVNEQDLELQRRVREAYQQLAAQLGWKLVDAARPPEEVEEDLWRLVKPLIPDYP